MELNEDKIKLKHYDFLTKKFTYEYYTDEELNEILAKREEEEKNKPLSYKEKIERLEEDNKMLESCILELAELQSKEIQNRIDLENAVIELAGIIGGA